ncbi:MAG: 1-acyl-sn-glycerol-3-phosphate acyltransferase [Gammaproteobacteria bacterium]|nr:MAG: 1-acyl-sn-glycerol-3-phosphate acyltransferase [Gammaproteobacteria bacterium]RLA52677.1 MAG: 1-acyl-sn-glycerol-3-phosphate acyltransferase [Gammaproteobacteria bacterium]
MLLARLNHGWRWIATAICFFVFGLGGVLLPLLVVPLLAILPGDKRRHEQRGQRMIHYSFRAYIWMMRALGVLTYEITGREKLRGAKLILANHPSLIDVIFLISMVPSANCIVKGKLVSNLFTRGPIRAAGYIVNDDGAFDVITAATAAFTNGNTLIIFPEGTRTTPHQAIELKRGAANLAIRASADITPVLIECSPSTLTKGDRWYHVPDKRVHFRIQVQDCLKINPYKKGIKAPKGARMLTRDLTDYFNKELKPYE